MREKLFKVLNTPESVELLLNYLKALKALHLKALTEYTCKR